MSTARRPERHLVVVPAQPPHRHDWQTRSCHRTSQGLLSYEHCGGCGRWRVHLNRTATTTLVEVP
ncbi:hypothetical protein BKA15_003751 [Microlunatus parietis]|uniref:Uncharacterized protein n=1 Tax=Microlunatus parietis TaxID=682979 RepID=A0A7Y9LC43_9ACTN|nr:hypothetical protein [Microlunatus parietis]